jgi:hypothetical protein
MSRWAMVCVGTNRPIRSYVESKAYIMSSGEAAGASKARNHLARFLREHGFKVRASRYGCPPTNDDFLAAVLEVVEGVHNNTEHALVVFHWWQATYQFIVPASTIARVGSTPRARHVLFSATTDDPHRPDRYRHTFYLASSEQGDVEVHHHEHWKNTYRTEDTTIIWIGEGE